MAHLLATIPWWLTAGLILAGAIMLAYANRRNKSGLRSAGLLVISVGVLLGAARFLIDTDAEKCDRRTRQIVDTVNSKDWPKLESLLDSDTLVDMGSKWPKLTGAKSIRAFAEALAPKEGVKSASIYILKTEQTPSKITVLFTAYTVQDATQDRPYPSDWEFDFHTVAKQWHLTEIKMLSLGNESTQ